VRQARAGKGAAGLAVCGRPKKRRTGLAPTIRASTRSADDRRSRPPLSAQRICKERPLDACAAALLSFGDCPLGYGSISTMISPPTAANRRQPPPTAANRRGSIESLHGCASRVCDGRSSNFGHTPGDCDSLDVRSSPERRRGRVFQPSSSSGGRAGYWEKPAHVEPEIPCLPFSLP
jgi:hypothetical protein